MKKLYLVTCSCHHISDVDYYVVAENMNEAEEKVLETNNSVGNYISNVKMIAENDYYGKPNVLILDKSLAESEYV